MKTELRFLLAIGLMLLVLIGTNALFPPAVPEGPPATDSTFVEPDTAMPGGTPDSGGAAAGDAVDSAPVIPRLPGAAGGGVPGVEDSTAAPVGEHRVAVEGPLFRYEFSTLGARMTSAVMRRFESLAHEGLVQLIPAQANGYFGQRLVVGSDTVDLARVPYSVEPAEGIRFAEGDSARTLRFTYEHPTSPFRFEIEYSFNPAMYAIAVRGSVSGLERPLLLTDMGAGLAFAEADSTGEARAMAYVHNHLQEGIASISLGDAEPRIVEGPLLWAAARSKFFVIALLAGADDAPAGEPSYLGGLLVRDSDIPDRVRVATAQTVASDGTFAYRLFMGPQDYGRLQSLGEGMDQVNPYGWRFFRPIIRPFVSIIMAIFVFLHTNLSLGYGWVLIVFGVAMRIVLFPLNHKAMRAQLRNMAVQPLVQEVQAKYKENPEKLQKEMMKLYKEHGFNPFAGCLPMLLPWPMLISLYFVFQNTIELRGVPFLWLPDLSTADPYYILPVVLAVSMFLMQWVSMRSMETPNPQMKMMMWMMPGMMLFIFLNLASGLNLYYATTNIATIPQQVWIANERKKMKGKSPPRAERD